MGGRAKKLFGIDTSLTQPAQRQIKPARAGVFADVSMKKANTKNKVREL